MFSRVFGRNEPLTFPVISAFLHLGHKYELVELQEAAISRLQACFSERLTDFKNVKTDNMVPDMDDLCFDPPVICMRLDEVPGVINLARAYALPSLLPSAFYLSSLLPFKTLMNGSKDQDGNQLLLSKEDIIRCIEGHSNLVLREILALSRMPYQVAQSCTSYPLCGVAQVLEPMQPRFDDVMCSAARSLPDGSWFEGYLELESVRNPCRESLKTKWDEFRATIWSDLIEVFSLQVDMVDYT